MSIDFNFSEKTTQLIDVISTFQEKPNEIPTKLKSIFNIVPQPTTTPEEARQQNQKLLPLRETIEYSFRKVLESLYNKALEKGISVTKSGAFELIKVAINCSLEIAADGSLPFVLLGNLLDMSTLTDCEDVFSFIEEHIDTLSNQLLITKGKLKLLEISRKLLRRLSKTDNTFFCCRVLILLAYVLPLDEPSGLNLTSQHNLSNETIIEEEDSSTPAAVDENLVDYAFYKQFWSLQKYCREPVLLYDTKHWRIFEDTVTQILKVFTSHSLANERVNLEELEDFFVPKYLSSRKLLTLQLNDAKFRSQILLQILIIFQYFDVPVKKVPRELTAGQKELVSKWTAISKDLLAAGSNNNGKSFTNAIVNILTRENNWSLWKKEKCKPPLQKAITEEEKIVPGPQLPARVKMGNKELDRLWKLGHTNVEEFLEQKTSLLSRPTYEEYAEKFKEQLDPDAGIEKEYSLGNNKIYIWKFLRLKCRKQLRKVREIKIGEPLDERIFKTSEPKPETKVDSMDIIMSDSPAKPPPSEAPKPPAEKPKEESKTPTKEEPKKEYKTESETPPKRPPPPPLKKLPPKKVETPSKRDDKKKESRTREQTPETRPETLRDSRPISRHRSPDKRGDIRHTRKRRQDELEPRYGDRSDSPDRHRGKRRRKTGARQ